MFKIPGCAQTRIHIKRGKRIITEPILICSTLNQVPRKTPYIYGIRHRDNDWGMPVTIEREVWVNRWGFIIAKRPIKIPKKGFLVIRKEDRYAWINILNNM